MVISPISNISFSKAVSFGNNYNSSSLVKALPVAFALMVPAGCTSDLNGPIHSGDIFEYNTPTELVLPQKAADKNQPPTLTAIDVVSNGNKTKTLYIYGYSNKGETTGVNSVNLRFVKTNGEESEVVLDGQLTGFCTTPVVNNKGKNVYLATIKPYDNDGKSPENIPIALGEPFGQILKNLLQGKKNKSSNCAMFETPGQFSHFHMGGTGGKTHKVSNLPTF